MRHPILIALLVLGMGTALAAGPSHRTLTFEDRIKAQEAIERVYYSHQIGATEPFEQAVSKAALEAKVRKSLDDTSITDELLQHEVERMAAGTKMPERLRELYAALGNDPFLIRECLARGTLAGRLSRSTAGTSPADRGVSPAPPGSAGNLACIADAWTPTSTTGAPTARQNHSAVWTGSLMIVWGGNGEQGLLNTGGRYDPATDTWTPTSTTGAPLARFAHTAVWTGSSMLIWGGYDFFNPMNSGGRYNPLTDSWTPTSVTGAPSARFVHTAVWTGSRMIVWGGWDTNLDTLATGGRYDPATDGWAPTSMVDAPSGRVFQSAVWTGSQMVVWGGFGNPGELNTGGRYEPASDTWKPMSVTGAPEGRESHTAVWTGSEMIVWGGFGSDNLNTGGRYDPVTNLWTATTTTAAPAAREYQTAVWTGNLMIVWGGYASGTQLNSGGRYDPTANVWTPTLPAGAPSVRSGHTAIWAGNLMLVWGGSEIPPVDTGAAYSPQQPTTTWYRDLDGDGYGDAAHSVTIAGCEGPAGYVRDRTDCNETNAAVHPGAAELCNGIDDNCDGAIDEDVNGVDSDADGVHNACDCCDFVWNPDQTDFDHDGQGDACDIDDGLIYVLMGSDDKNGVGWAEESGYTSWNRYRGSLAVLRATGQYTQAPGSNPLAARDCGLPSNYLIDADTPGPGQVAFDLVTGVASGVESSLGTNRAGVPRVNANPCP